MGLGEGLASRCLQLKKERSRESRVLVLDHVHPQTRHQEDKHLLRNVIPPLESILSTGEEVMVISLLPQTTSITGHMQTPSTLSLFIPKIVLVHSMIS
jgi:hypothetical protein